MTALPRISIVTPSYNQAQYLEECIDSVLSQGYPNLEYVVMDGGSTDGSVEIIKKYEKYLTYWQSCPDGGQYAAINDGFARTTGEIMAWINSDDRYHPNAFLKVSNIFSKLPYVNWLTGVRTVWGSKSEIKNIDRIVQYFSRRKYFSGNFGNPCIQQESTFWRRQLWDRAGGCLSSKCHLAADAELWLRFFRFEMLYTVKAFLGGFRLHGNQRSLLNMQQYVREIQNEVWTELQNICPDDEFHSMPEPIYFDSSTYKNFARDFSVPLFNEYNNPQWLNYLRSLSDWILNNEGGLESAQLFFDEISLWVRETSELPNFLLNTLKKQINKRNEANNLIAESERYYNNGIWDQALIKAFEAIDIWPTSADGNNNLGVLLYHKGKIKEAIEYLVLVTQFDVSKREAFRNLAVIFHELGQRDKIQWALDYYLAWFPDDAEMEEFYRRLLECP